MQAILVAEAKAPFGVDHEPRDAGAAGGDDESDAGWEDPGPGGSQHGCRGRGRCDRAEVRQS